MSFKVRLLLGAAAPMVFALPAVAQVSISTATTAPVNTATANAGAAANIEITATGSITTPAAANTVGVTIGSSNSVTNSGAINVADSNNSVGVRILPGFTNSYTQTGGLITLLEDFTRPDTDSDGDLDGPFASGTGRIGLLVDSGGTMNGNLTLTAGGITVEGNDSFGVSVRSILNGNFRQNTTITAVGNNDIGVDIQQNVTGNVEIGGVVNGQGQGATGVRVLGNVAGEFQVSGAINTTGFTSTSVSNYVDPDFLLPGDPTSAELLDTDDLLVGSSALIVRGDLARGFLVNGTALGGVDPTDDVKDVVQDFNENRGSGTINSFGSAPALVIQALDGAAGDTLQLGRVRESVRDTLDDDADSNIDEIIGVFDYDYGFINRGTIGGNGLNIGFLATGVKIAGSADGTHQTIIDGGVYNSGTIFAAAAEADSVAFDFGSGATTPQLINTGTITANLNTETNHDATALLIRAGATLPSLTNSGLISSNVRGYDGDTVAVRDLSGTLTSVTNNSRIVAGHTDDDTEDDITTGLGVSIALDLSHSANAVTLTQTDVVDNTRIFGDVLFGAGGDRFNLLSGEVTGKVDFGSAGADTLAVSSAKLFGDTAFHGGTSSALLSNGAQVTGKMAFTGAGTMNLSGASVYNGAVSSTGSLNMLVDNSTLNNSAAGTLNVATMTLQNNAKVGFVIDNARITGNIPVFNVGTANFAANTVFTPIFQEFRNQTFTLRVLNATNLTLGGPVGAMLNAQSPFLYDVALTKPAAQNALDLTFSVKTAAQLGLNTRSADAYAAVLNLAEQDATVGAAITSLSNQPDFLRGWNDLLPSQDAAVLQVLAANSSSAFGATAHRLDLISEKPDAPGGAWVEEFGVYHDSDPTTDRLGVSGSGFGVAAGIDLISTGTALIGAYSALDSVELDEKGRGKAPLNVAQTTVGFYGGWRAGGLAANAATSIGFSKFQSDRNLTIGTLTDRIKGEWTGTSFNAAGRVSYTQQLGFMEFKPYLAADYIGFKEDGYRELGSVDDLEIVAGDADASLATGSYGLNIAAHLFADDAYVFSPELRIGKRQVLWWDASPAQMRFAGGSGTTFSLNPGGDPEDADVYGLGLNVNSQFLNIKLGYDTEISDTSKTHYGSITLRMAFW